MANDENTEAGNDGERNGGTEGEKDGTEVRDVLIETAQVQMASLNAGIAFWRGWVEEASRFAEETNRRLARLADEGDPGATLGEMTDASRSYLRELSKLPEVAARTFTEELDRADFDGPRRRSGRAKD